MDISKSSSSPLGSFAANQQLNQALSNANSNQVSFAQLLRADQSPATAVPGSPIPKSNPVSLDSTSTVEASAKHQADPDSKLKQAFNEFVGQTFFTELIKSYRSTQNTTPYFDGGQAEKIFRGQLDQVLSESLAERSADKIAGPMFEQFQRSRKPGN